MAKFIFFVILILVVLFLIFGWKEKDKEEFLKGSKAYQQVQESSCEVKSKYQRAEEWTKKQLSELKKIN